MLDCQKDKFNLSEEISYINCAYMSPNLRTVEQAGVQAILQKSQPWKVTRSDFFAPVEKLKSTFAKLINCPDSQRIAIIPSASYGIASIVKNVHATDKDNIILVGEGFPSNYYSWKKLSDSTGAEIKIITAPQISSSKGKIWNKNILDAIDENTIAIALGNIHWADGTLFDLEKIREKTNKNKALMIIDGTQSIGAYPFDIQSVKPDALVCAGYKWLLGPYVSGVGYFGEKFDSGEPIEENWINRLDSQQFENLVNYQPDYKTQANRYSMGEQSNFIGVPMLQKSLDQLLEWGVENIQNYCKNITQKPIEKLLDMGCQIEEENYRVAHLFGVKLSSNMDMKKLKFNFEKNKLKVSQRGDAIRVAPHVYNNSEDFEKLIYCFKRSTSQKTIF
ncbi:MAG: aminotransferase class V-fold PLP-dependent enzyme [Saprospiraceae bacterium]|nr:aminotransferase class V-fold PLP-dependent enzyme [Saprospiraceae bacterium]